jgi:hypothetical protein
VIEMNTVAVTADSKSIEMIPVDLIQPSPDKALRHPPR